MNKVKGLLVSGLLNIGEFVTFIILLPLAPLVILVGPVRQLIFTISLRSKRWQKDYPGMFKTLLFFFYMQIAIGVPGIIYEYLGSEHLLNAIVAAGFFLAFVALQLPRMLPPYFVAVFMPAEDGSYREDTTFSIQVKPSIPTLLYFRITNLGTTFFKDCVCSFSFDEGFTVLGSPQDCKGLDFEKNLVVQEKNHCAQFLPNANYLGIAPCNHSIFPVRVQTPAKLGKYKVKITLSSESTWGEAQESLTLEVTDSK